MDGNQERRLQKLESGAPAKPGEDILIRIRFAGEPATYAKPEFLGEPDSDGRRFCVQFPLEECSENPVCDTDTKMIDLTGYGAHMKRVPN